MTNEEYRQVKEQCLADIREALPRYTERLKGIDVRMLAYVQDVAMTGTCPKSDGEKAGTEGVSTPKAGTERDSRAVTNGTWDVHNVDECLAVRKFLRMLDAYAFDVEKVQRVYKEYEMLKFSGLKGRQCYKLTPIQTFMLANPFGFVKEDGNRKITFVVYFIPRKFCKTTMGGFFQFHFFFFEDANSEGYCVANSQDQSKILYKMAFDLIHQLDPDEKRIRFTATEINWKTGQPREAKVAALSAGGKAKDGMFAQLVTADEYGSAGYVKDHSDMANLLQVMRGSMGPRREPMTLITTTAGRVMEGPFELLLRNMQQELMKEVDVPLDGEAHKMDGDWTFLMALHPDVWEMDEESLQEPRVWRKCNPHIGVTVQPDYYENEWKAMMLDEETKREQITKLFNVFQSDRNTAWLTAEDIRPLQEDRRIDDLNSEEGWVCFVGMDFSKGDDLNAQSYLCYNTQTGEFFADMDAWISERSLVENSNHLLYQMWKDKGWLRTSPGKTINENLILERLIEISEHLSIIRIGYDTYDASRFINAIGTWAYEEGIDPKSILRPVSQQFATYNSVVQEMDYMVKNDPALIHFSMNPMWPWEFGNVMLAVSNDGMENVKPVKSGENAKVDNVQCLLSALHLFDEVEGTEVK